MEENYINQSNLFNHGGTRTTVRLGLSVWSLMRPECMWVLGTECEAGLELELFTILATLLNFTLELKFSDTAGCGRKNSNDEWDGLLGMLTRNEIDILGNLCTLDELRISDTRFKYSWPVLQFKQSFLIKAPELRYFFHIGAPFQLQSWLAIFLVVALFGVLFAISYKLLSPIKDRSFIVKAISDIMNIISGGEYEIITKITWISFICFTGFVMTIYSTFITVALLKPIPIERPFKNQEQLAEALKLGEYKLFDWYNTPKISSWCSDPNICSNIYKAMESHGYHYINIPNKNGSEVLLNELLIHPNLVMVKGKYHLRVHLNGFKYRSKLWLIENEESPEEWLVYFYSNNASWSKLLDQMLILLSDGKDNLKALYYGLSYQVIELKTIKGRVPEKVKLDMSLIYGPLVCYGGGVIIACGVFIGERMKKQRRTGKNLSESRSETSNVELISHTLEI